MFNTVGRWLVRLLLPTAVVSFVVGSATGQHGPAVVTPSLSVHGLGVGGTTGSLRHLIMLLMVTFFGVMLESLVLCRSAFARGEPGAVATLLATARRLALGVARLALPVVQSPALRATSRVDDDPGSGILGQLRSGLSIVPTGPPARFAFGSDPSGPFGQSGHRAEVCVAA